jgi:ATP diphosphatase
MFALVNLARHLRLNPEDALRTSAQRFYRRFEDVERAARDNGKDVREMEPEDLDRLWDQAKTEV